MFNYFLAFLLGNKVAFGALVLAFMILIGTAIESISPKHVKVKRRIIQKDSKLAIYAENIVSKLPMFISLRNHMRIQLGLVTSKNDNKNEFYANMMVFGLIGLAIAESVGVLFIGIPGIFKPFLVILGLVIPYMIANIYINVKRKKVYNYFPELVSVYISKYQSSKNIKEALRMSIPDLPIVLRHEIKRLTNSMNSSTSYNKALDEFDARINYIMCTAFVALLKTGYTTNGDIIESLMELETYISQERLEEQRKIEQLKDKKINLYLFIGAMPISYYAIVSKLQERAINFYWHTVQGQAVMGGCILFSIVTIVFIIVEDSL